MIALASVGVLTTRRICFSARPMLEMSRCRSRSSSKIRPICGFSSSLSAVSCHYPLHPHEQREAEAPLRLFQQLGGRGLRNVQKTSRIGQGSGLQDGLEHLDVAQMDPTQGGYLGIDYALAGRGLHQVTTGLEAWWLCCNLNATGFDSLSAACVAL